VSNARRVPCTNEQYHADTTAISNSGLGEILEDPAYYYGRRVAKTIPAEESDALAFGTLLHSALLVEGAIGNGIVIIPRSVLNSQGHRKGKDWLSFKADHPDKILCKADEPLVCMVESLKRCPQAVMLLESCVEFESTIYWHDDEHGVECRVRIDGLHSGGDVAIDLKSTTDAEAAAFAKSITNFGYDRQAAFYSRGVEELLGKRPAFVFIAMQKEPPYRVETYDLSERFLKCGEADVERALKLYAQCLKTGQWVPPLHGRIITLEPPGYRLYSNDWSLANG
jgi:hypothetical protein